ncbi:MAG: MurR/RpiR family transcriptional regulator [Thermodesulfobacteriota bacterium]
MTESAPKNIEELRCLYISIRSGTHAIRLTDRTLAVIKKMLDDPHETATKSISEIAEENGINTSSVTRLAQKLGFKGFPGLKDLFRQHVKQRKSYYSQQVRKFLEKGLPEDNDKFSLLRHVIQDEWGNVMFMADAFDDRQFTRVVDLIVNAEEIQIIGLRGSYPLAYYLSFYMKMIHKGVSLIGQAGHTLAEDISRLKPGDLLIAIGVNPYSRDTVEACRICCGQNVDVFAITDSVSSPLTDETENYLIVSTQGDYFFSPITATVICIETLLSELVKQLDDNAIQQRLDHTETILDRMKVEM